MVDGERRCDFEFREMTGELELMLHSKPNTPATPVSSPVERVTQVLSHALGHVGGQQATLEMVNALSVGDRQFLMRHLAAHVDDEPVWLTATCHHCSEKFDVSFLYTELPVKPAGEGYPSREVDTSLGKVTVSAPTGNDQLALVGITDDQQALLQLVERLVTVQGRKKPLRVERLTVEDLEAIESTAEDLSPEIATQLLANCPNCDAQNRLNITPYSCFERSVEPLFSEVHTLAMYYHWSEQAILDLPRVRRQRYLHLIDRSRGITDRPHSLFEEGHG